MLSRLREWSAQRAARYADPPPVDPPSCDGDLRDIPSLAFDRHLLAADPQARRLSRAEADAAIARAVADGHALAAQSAESPRALAAKLGVRVETVAGNNRFGTVFQFAEYAAKPPRVLLYRHAMDIVAEAAARYAIALFPVRPEDVYLAHELYHHIDQHRPIPVSRSSRATIFALGPLRLTSGLQALAEIGACSFAAALTAFPCHPRLLDLLALRTIAPATAAATEAALRQGEIGKKSALSWVSCIYEG
jgi:hypothetical protein